MNRRSSAAGFTLIEVMVALVIVAVALPALMVTVYRQVDGVGYLRDKSMAGWVAANQLTEARLLVRDSTEIGEASASGVEEMASRQWYWWTEREKTTVEDMFKLTVRVAMAEEDEKTPLVTLVGYLAPMATAQLPADGNSSGVGPESGSGP